MRKKTGIKQERKRGEKRRGIKKSNKKRRKDNKILNKKVKNGHGFFFDKSQ
jgi:hypothetical protein